MEFASRPVYLAVANGAPAVITARPGMVYGFVFSCAAVAQLTIRSGSAGGAIIGIVRVPANQTLQWLSWPVMCPSLHITNDTGATTVDITVLCGSANV